LRKAIDANPDDSNAYGLLARVLKSRNHPDEAITVWRGLLKRDPTNVAAHREVADLLMFRKRYDEAIVELEALNDLGHPNSSIAAQLAEAFLGAGEVEKGAGMLRKLAEADPRSETLADVACRLADANSNLTDAQEYAEKAVQAEEKASSEISIDAEGTGQSENTRALAKSWDALGWVNFRLGNLSKAENYLHAAWMAAQNSSAADHLGQLYQREGKKQLAIQMYGGAVAFDAGNGDAKDRLEHLAGDRFVAAGAIAQAHDHLYQVRTIRLAVRGTPTGSAEVVILFSKGPKIEQVRLLSGPDTLKSAEKAIAGTKFDVPFPDDGPTRLVHSGTLSCGKYSGCTFVLMPLESAH
jgi:tetratricopeptide (TPR) repeat protein